MVEFSLTKKIYDMTRGLLFDYVLKATIIIWKKASDNPYQIKVTMMKN